jgi:outer membrane lipoprotein-sorting protein
MKQKEMKKKIRKKKAIYFSILVLVLIFSPIFKNIYASQKTDQIKSKSISQVKTLEIIIKEIFTINKTVRETNYIIKFKIPNIIKKEMTKPELNKGEIYIYNNGKRMTYLPLFNQKKIDDISISENRIIDIFNYIFEMEKNDKNFQKEYYDKNLKGVKLGENTVIEFHDYQLYDGYLFPKNFIVIENGKRIGEFQIEDMKINKKFDDKEFLIE